jgi:hypothetical protein
MSARRGDPVWHFLSCAGEASQDLPGICLEVTVDVTRPGHGCIAPLVSKCTVSQNVAAPPIRSHGVRTFVQCFAAMDRRLRTEVRQTISDDPLTPSSLPDPWSPTLVAPTALVPPKPSVVPPELAPPVRPELPPSGAPDEAPPANCPPIPEPPPTNRYRPYSPRHPSLRGRTHHCCNTQHASWAAARTAFSLRLLGTARPPILILPTP